MTELRYLRKPYRSFIEPIFYRIIRYLVIFYMFFHCEYQYLRGKYEKMIMLYDWPYYDEDDDDVCLLGGHFVPLPHRDMSHANGETNVKKDTKVLPPPKEDKEKEEKKEEEEITEILVDLNKRGS